MDDRTLLEKAAKAAGIKLEKESPWFGYSDSEGFFRLNMDGSAVTWRWNPLADDGDALRLAVKLEMDISFPDRYTVWALPRMKGMSPFTERATMGYGIEEATRRAIVRAAAAQGETR